MLPKIFTYRYVKPQKSSADRGIIVIFVVHKTATIIYRCIYTLND